MAKSFADRKLAAYASCKVWKTTWSERQNETKTLRVKTKVFKDDFMQRDLIDIRLLIKDAKPEQAVRAIDNLLEFVDKFEKESKTVKA